MDGNEKILKISVGPRPKIFAWLISPRSSSQGLFPKSPKKLVTDRAGNHLSKNLRQMAYVIGFPNEIQPLYTALVA
jgi:hypothetical protein